MKALHSVGADFAINSTYVPIYAAADEGSITPTVVYEVPYIGIPDNTAVMISSQIQVSKEVAGNVMLGHGIRAVEYNYLGQKIHTRWVSEPAAKNHTNFTPQQVRAQHVWDHTPKTRADTYNVVYQSVVYASGSQVGSTLSINDAGEMYTALFVPYETAPAGKFEYATIRDELPTHNQLVVNNPNYSWSFITQTHGHPMGATALVTANLAVSNPNAYAVLQYMRVMVQEYDINSNLLLTRYLSEATGDYISSETLNNTRSIAVWDPAPRSSEATYYTRYILETKVASSSATQNNTVNARGEMQLSVFVPGSWVDSGQFAAYPITW